MRAEIRHTSDICAARASSSRFALDKHLMAYSRPYTVDGPLDPWLSKSMEPTAATWPSSEGGGR